MVVALLWPMISCAGGTGQGFTPTAPGTYRTTDAAGLTALIDARGMEIQGDGGSDWQERFNILGFARSGASLTTWTGGEAMVGGAELSFSGNGMVVCYQRSAQGVRQNFVVLERPAGSGELAVRLSVSGDLVPKLNGSDELALGPACFPRFTYRDLRCWDALKHPLNAHMRLEGDRLSLVVDDAGATYPIVIDPISTTANTLLVGTQAGSEFGISVSTAGDLNGDGRSDVVVGAWLASLGQTNEGAAYVYYGTSTGIGTTPSLTLQVDQAGAQFGCSVSTAGDINGDGFSDLIVGGRTWESSTVTDLSEGAAFIYYGSAAGISTTPDLRIESNHAGDNFGSNVATAGDVNNDGYSDVLVGAYLSEYPTYQEGAVWLYLGTATGLSTTAVHRLERNINAGHFGRSLASAGDVNGDGYSDVIIGAPDAPNVNADAGAAFVWHGSATGLGAGFNPAPALTLYGSTVLNGSFGWSVSTAGDVNGDGYSDAIVGAYLDNNGQVNEGTARVFMGSATGLSGTPAIILESNVATTWFGRSVASAGDINGDGYGDVMVGAPLITNGQTQEGVVRVFLGSSTGVTAMVAAQFELDNAGANVGESLWDPLESTCRHASLSIL